MENILILTKRFSIPNANQLEVALKHGAYSSLEKLFSMKPEDVVEEVKKSNLKGRGGAGFPTGLKWSFIPKDTKKPIYLCVNADESEPGTFTDRYIMEYDPHLLIEGIINTSYAIKSHTAYIYIRGEYVKQYQILSRALEEARKAGYVGKNILGSGYDLDIWLHRGAGAYICGEETGLIESLEGKKGQPRIKPPFPAVEGLFRSPTIVNNVKTIASVPWIVLNGGEAYAKIGTKDSTGTNIFGVSGHVNQPGYWELPFGMRFLEFLEKYPKGVKGGKLKALIPGGSSTPVLTAEECEDLYLSYESMLAHKTFLGTGGMIVMNEHTDMVKALKTLTRFYSEESCGQCTPCREGTSWLDRLLDRILNREATTKELDLLIEISDNMEGKTICALAAACAMPVRSFVTKFRSDFEKYVKPISIPVHKVAEKIIQKEPIAS
ncbi:MAG: NADH-quinone oxidoreductase subunit NuoF [Leptospiraceae bacterium]|nr:NADH-quinone oxidoreductase subunit NuoF [Leptospiraceae bacterium]MDW7975831.1 NADH-quinone oxidoreductase subunit NuoF [Leptospiraceae bacterium]